MTGMNEASWVAGASFRASRVATSVDPYQNCGPFTLAFVIKDLFRHHHIQKEAVFRCSRVIGGCCCEKFEFLFYQLVVRIGRRVVESGRV